MLKADDLLHNTKIKNGRYVIAKPLKQPLIRRIKERCYPSS
ncbi:hypothetical protein BH753_gp063 [Bacillus phage Shbh1]|uniref:Uncharacterized protein n=1 Tax=Bacillus phage Shbh1 TaxID=1796992 RepID=A0A142F188_9CAUD|nr:hypothetical protein BH753_gp063 [Bacillus phage Shbh1]AMQ66545.1 hypothetical protein [Bacillus phage Shbh1]